MIPNKSGRGIEDLLADHFTRAGVCYKRQEPIGQSIYGYELRADFVLINLVAFPRGVIVESKWQDVGGTADEKFPYLVDNIRKCYPMPTVIVASGKGARAGAIAWLRERVDGQQLVAVYDMEAFLSWVMRAEKHALAM